MHKINVLIVDGSISCRESFRRALEGIDDITVMKAASNGRIGLKQITQSQPDLVLLSTDLEDMTAADFIRRAFEAVPGLGRKLPHYHKYSYLGFEGVEPVNRVKGRWPVLDSSMTVFVSDEKGSYSKVPLGKLPGRKPLAALPAVFLKERIPDRRKN